MQYSPYILNNAKIDTGGSSFIESIILKIPALDKTTAEDLSNSFSGKFSISQNKTDNKLFDCFLNGSYCEFENLNKNPKINKITEEVLTAYRNHSRNNFNIKLPSGNNLILGNKTCIMGVLNITPDSFSDGGKFVNIDNAVKHAIQMQNDGADIIDIGGESSRPGSKQISAKEELARIEPILKELTSVLKIPISVDTYKAKVASKALELGADIINDISAMRMDPNMPDVIAENNSPIVLMHMQGTPQNMQNNPHYDALLDELISFFKQNIEKAVKSGINPDNIIIDPGIGFGKTTEHNLSIIKNLNCFRSLGCPILMGTSRKSLIGNILNLPPDDRIEGTSATVAVSILNNANIVRVHDVLQMKRVAIICDSIKNTN